MKALSTSLAALGLAGFATLGAQAQLYKIHNADVSAGAMSPFTTVLTSNGKSQYTTDTTGFLFSFKEHPVSWAGVEVNYGYSKFSERYVAPASFRGTANVPTSMHEATGAYIFHLHFKRAQPFVAIGGGALNFDPAGPGNYQWRGTGLVEYGMDFPSPNPHLGFRIEGRDLIYRAPNFGTPAISTQAWVSTAEPSASVYFRF